MDSETRDNKFDEQPHADQPRESGEDETRILKVPPGGRWETPPEAGRPLNSEWRRQPLGYEWRTYSEQLNAPAVGTRAPARRKKRSLLRRIIRDLVIPLVAAFGIAMFAQATIAKPYQIPSGSMLPTIQLDDRILANRIIYHFHSIERGDVVVFKPPNAIDTSIPYVKRVIGLPGDTVEIRSGNVLVNGEEFRVETASLPTYIKPIDTVPEGMLFVLGDNRNESSDSHVWGYVPVDNVIGRADLIYWPPSHIQWLGN